MTMPLTTVERIVYNAERVPCACGAHPEGTPQVPVGPLNVEKRNIQRKGGGCHFKRHCVRLQCQVCKTTHMAYHDVFPLTKRGDLL